jgi:signal transduction histidine kinase
MEQHDDHLQIEVRDEGAGFDPAAITGTSSGGISSRFGLLSIQERMRALGGSFIIDSTLGQGTTARLSLRLARSGELADCIVRSPEPGMFAQRGGLMTPPVLR